MPIKPNIELFIENRKWHRESFRCYRSSVDKGKEDVVKAPVKAGRE